MMDEDEDAIELAPLKRKVIEAVKTWRQTGLDCKVGEADPEGAQAHLQATLALIAATDELIAAEKGES
jgi:hypothetical protein